MIVVWITMKLHQFEKFVRGHQEWFRGPHPVSAHEIDRAEASLQVRFPTTLRWLLERFGHWRGTGVASLPVMIAKTKAFRPDFPTHWIVLTSQRGGWGLGSLPADEDFLVILMTSPEARDDGESVILCTEEGQVLKRYSGYSEYVRARLQELKKTTRPEYLSCPVWRSGPYDPLLTDGTRFDLEEFSRRLWETLVMHGAKGHKSQQSQRRTVSSSMRYSGDVTYRPLSPTSERRSEPGKPGELRVRDAECSTSVQDQDIGSTQHFTGHPHEIPQTGILRNDSQMRREGISLKARAAKIVAERRAFLKSQHVDVDVLFEKRSSSPRNGRILPEEVPHGCLVLFPFDERTSLEAFWRETGLTNSDNEHLVSLLELDSEQGPQCWAAVWWPSEQQALPFRRVDRILLSSPNSLRELPRLILGKAIEAELSGQGVTHAST